MLEDVVTTPAPRRWTIAVGLVGVALIVGVIVAVGARVAEADRAMAERELGFAATPERLLNASGTDAEAALDSISGGRADLIVDPWDAPLCPEAIACVSDDTDVHIRARDSILTDQLLVSAYGVDWQWVMRHEYAHVVQRRWYVELYDSAEFRQLFVDAVVPDGFDPTLDYPIEHSADCMAVALDPGYLAGYPGECTPAQVDFARTIWDGSFRD